jgi:hypothetical protein
MKGVIISNDFYVSKYLMKDVVDCNYDVVFESDFRCRVINKSFARFKAFLPSKPGSNECVLAFAIENIIVLDQIYRKIGKPKVWLWNPISSMTRKNKKLFLSYVQRKEIEVWTFDKNDVELYGFAYHDQIHSSSLIKSDVSLYNRAFFSGVDKGRLEVVKNISKELDLISIDNVIHVVRDKNNNDYSVSDLGVTTDTYLSFDEYLEQVECSDILIDVAQNNQRGVTLRVIEALFQNKKLITTNPHVVSMDGYCPENIYIYGEENHRTIKEFIETPTQVIKDSIKLQYTLKHLLEKMFVVF